VPDHLRENNVWQRRFQSIVDHERHLANSGTRVVKFFLHLSKEEQRQRFLARIDEPHKHWKFKESDIAEREHWDDYMRAYEKAVSATSTDFAPWYVVPADDKRNAHLFIARIIADSLKSLDLRLPEVTPQRLEEMQHYRDMLLGEGPLSEMKTAASLPGRADPYDDSNGADANEHSGNGRDKAAATVSGTNPS
jgi:hypothetical protein